MAIILFSDKTPTSEETIACGIFADGQLQDKLGYDVICPRYAENSHGWWLQDLHSDGVYDVLIQHFDEQIPAKLFYWKSKYGSHRGLACLETDTKAMAYAQDRFNHRADHL